MLSIAEGFPCELTAPSDPPLNKLGPLIAEGWEVLLQNHPDRIFAKTLILITKQGAKVGYSGPQRFQKHPSHASALNAPELLIADLQKQVSRPPH